MTALHPRCWRMQPEHEHGMAWLPCRMEKGEQREQYERSAVLPVATENVDRFKFYTAKPS